jgi:hypothetical protein
MQEGLGGIHIPRPQIVQIFSENDICDMLSPHSTVPPLVAARRGHHAYCSRNVCAYRVHVD